MRVLICGATTNEARACELGISDAGAANQIEVLCTGMGFDRARQALRERLTKGTCPDLIVSSGVAGSLSSELALHSWVVGHSVYIADGASQVQQVTIAKFRDHFKNAKACTFVSTNNLAFADAKTLEAYRDVSRPLAVDMESAALAQVAHEFDVEFMVLRLISDVPDAPLPGFASEFAAAMTTTSRLAQLTHVLRGTRQALGDPKGILRMTKEPRVWSKLIREGWREHAGSITS